MLNPFSTGTLRRKSVGAMILASAFWGLGTVMSKGVLVTLSPLTLLIVQLTTSVTLLWTITISGNLQRHIKYAKIPKRARLRKLLELGFPGLLEPGLSYTFGLLGLAMTTASNASLIGAIEPVMVVGIAWVFLRERVSLPLLTLSAVAIVGVTLTVGFDLNFSSRSLVGDLLVIAATFCAASYVVLSRQSVRHLEPLPLAAIQQSIGLVWVLLVWLFLLRQGKTADLVGISPTTWGLAIASGIVQYTLAFWFYLISLKGLPVTIAAQFLSLIPIFGVCGAYLFLGERFTPIQGVGMALTVAAVVWIAHCPSKSPKRG